MAETKTLPYERQAMHGEELPAGLDYPDQVMYMQLRLLYDSLKKGIVDRETGTREKKELLKQYQLYKYNWETGNRWAEAWRASEQARIEYRKNPTQENADKLLQSLDGMDRV